MNRILPLVVVIASAGTVPTVAAPADTLPGSSAPMGQVEHAPLMNVITLGLMQVGAESKFLLRIADAIGLDEAQRATLASLLFAFEADKVRREADLRVAEAELNRLLTRENVDLVAVRAKIDEAADIASEGQMQQIEGLLRATAVLSHEQHLRIVTLVSGAVSGESVGVPWSRR